MEISIKTYLSSKVPFDIPEETINSILYDRNVGIDALLENISIQDKELCVADLYMYCSILPTTRSSVEDSHGSWRHKDGGFQFTERDKKEYRRLAYDIYDKYGIVHRSKGFKIVTF